MRTDMRSVISNNHEIQCCGPDLLSRAVPLNYKFLLNLGCVRIPVSSFTHLSWPHLSVSQTGYKNRFRETVFVYFSAESVPLLLMGHDYAVSGTAFLERWRRDRFGDL